MNPTGPFSTDPMSRRPSAIRLCLPALLAAALPAAGVLAVEPIADSSVVLEAGDVFTQATGSWQSADKATAHEGSAFFSRKAGSYRFSPGLPAGSYAISVWWPVWNKLASSTRIIVSAAGGSSSPVTVNQRAGGGRWNPLGTFDLDPDSAVTIVSRRGSMTCADAVLFEPLVAPPPPPPADDPPSAPMGVTAAGGDAVVEIDWQDNGEADLAGYNMYRAAEGEGQYSLVAQGLRESLYSDGTVLNGTQYSYVVTALDAAGQESPPSAPATALPAPPLPPPSNRTFTLNWDPPSTNADGTPLVDLAGFMLYQGSEPGRYTTAMDVGLVLERTFDSMAPGNYFYSVTAYDTSRNESGFSAELSILVQ
jgi:hypothetical protein